MTPIFNMTGPGGLIWSPSLIALLMLVLLCLALGLTIHRAMRRLSGTSTIRRWLVLVLNLTAFAAVTLLLVPPERFQEQQQEALLLTTGADTNSLPINRRVFALPGVEIPADKEHVQVLSLPQQLMLREPGLTAIEVRGYGLSREDWKQLPASLRVRFEPRPLAGPVDVQWPRLLGLGEPLLLSGRLSLMEDDHVARLVLLDPAGLAVAETPARSGQSFALQTVPGVRGAMTYRLQVWRGDILIADEPVSTYVRANRGSRLLVVQSAPSFDTAQLVNWAADRGHQAVVLTRISKDRDLAQGFNTPDQQQLALNSELLDWADLIMMDGRRWSNLNAAQARLVLEAVSGGAGLLLLADSQLAEWLQGPANDVLSFELQAAEPDQAAWPLWPGGSPATPLPLAPWRLITTSRAAVTHTLTGSEEGPVLEAWQAVGSGRVAVSLIRERHRWFTEGQQDNATRFWSYLMRTLSRPATGGEWLAPANHEMLRPDTVFDFCAVGVEPASYQLTARSSDLLLEGELLKHADGFPLSCGRARSEHEGWHTLQLGNAEPDEDRPEGDKLMVRVFAEQEWRVNDMALLKAATRNRALGSTGSSDHQVNAVRMPAFSPWWSFLGLLVAGGLLWLERRLFDLR